MQVEVDEPAYEQLREDLREALNHLHDPGYAPSTLLASVVAGDPSANVAAVQVAIMDAVKLLKPPDDIPDSAATRRSYDLLRYRFVQRLTQEQTAERLHLTVRSIRREQRVSTHMLARFLWEHRFTIASRAAILEAPSSEAGDGVASSLSWRAQARRDLAALRADSPAAVADVAAAVRRAVDLERALVANYGIELVMGRLSEGLMAAVHPTALRQAIIMAVGQFSRASAAGEVVVDVVEVDGAAHIRLTGPSFHRALPEAELLAELLRLQDGQLIVSGSDGPARMTLVVPAVGKVTVAIVDDNDDFVHFCRRCVRGTRYRICPPEARTLGAIKAMAPDVILLDILLPDVDGWELLSQLAQDPETAPIPVVICSIVPEDELASSMGAIACLPKPIHHQELIATLDRAVEAESPEHGAV